VPARTSLEASQLEAISLFYWLLEGHGIGGFAPRDVPWLIPRHVHLHSKEANGGSITPQLLEQNPDGVAAKFFLASRKVVVDERRFRVARRRECLCSTGQRNGTFQSHADYTAGIGPKVPWKIKFRDYLAYVLISLGVVRAVLLIALYEAQRHADFVNCRKIPIALIDPYDQFLLYVVVHVLVLFYSPNTHELQHSKH
jgi:hypothetical protein